VISLVSVRHSGTHSCAEMFRRAGAEVEMLHFGEGARPRGLVVTPLRPPEDVWSSWVKRGGAYSAQEFQRVWGTMLREHGLLMRLNDDAGLASIREATGFDVRPPWPRLNQRVGVPYGPPCPAVESL
jgi:hypothetical protein